MSHILYLEPFSGLSGDMLNGLLLDLGADVDNLKKSLTSLSNKEFEIKIEHITKNNILGTDFDVIMPHHQPKDCGIAHNHHHSRNLKDILTLIESSALSSFVKKHASNVFYDIAKAEANVHNKSLNDIHFHEVGAIDSIVDVISFFVMFEQLQISQVYSTTITEGCGFINVAHGTMPVPVPAVIQLLNHTDFPIKQDTDVETELVTPTGLAILKELKPIFQPLPNCTQIKIGYGFGKKNTGKFNALRGRLFSLKHSQTQINQTNDQIIKIEANIDDQSPEQLGYIMNLLLENGALDVFYTSIQMKKNRPATMLSVLVDVTQKDNFIKLILKHTSTIGVRYQIFQRVVMRRSFDTLTTSYGKIRIKICQFQDLTKKTLEFDDCAEIAKINKLPISTVYQTANAALNNHTN